MRLAQLGNVASLVAGLCAAALPCAAQAAAPTAGTPGAPGLAIHASKLLCVPWEGRQVVDRGTVLVRDGRIEKVGARADVEVPPGYEVLDAGALWLMPGMIDLHCHVAGPNLFVMNDINDMVYLANPGLRVSPAVIPGNPDLERAVAGGVTTVLYIPGSGTNISGQGVLLRTGLERYEEMRVRDPGSLKLAQAGNPERWVATPQRSLMNWNTRNTFKRGLAYAERWRAFEAGDGPEPEVDPEWEVFRDLAAGRAQVSTHTQIYQVVNMTIDMIHDELGLDVFIDHGTFDGYLAAPRAEAAGVPAILGPRSVQVPSRLHINAAGGRNDGDFRGIAAQYQLRGHTMFGFNTDSPIVPEEELPVQAAVAVRYGLDDTSLATVRGLTIVPARTVGIDDQVGSIEVGKEADLLLLTGHPADARTSIELVLVQGRRVYDSAAGRRF